MIIGQLYVGMWHVGGALGSKQIKEGLVNYTQTALLVSC